MTLLIPHVPRRSATIYVEKADRLGITPNRTGAVADDRHRFVRDIGRHQRRQLRLPGGRGGVDSEPALRIECRQRGSGAAVPEHHHAIVQHNELGNVAAGRGRGTDRRRHKCRSGAGKAHQEALNAPSLKSSRYLHFHISPPSPKSVNINSAYKMT